MFKKRVLNLFYGKHFYLLAMALCLSLTAFSQKVTVTGTVTDSTTKEPLVGVSVLVRGTANGVASDINGKYTISAAPDASLIFRYVSYEPKTVNLDGRSVINVTLSSSSQGLNEVVVVAYGSQKKESITGAISSISTREIKQSPAANLAVSLAGRLPGLTSIQTSGQPGRDATSLYLRGVGTLNGQAPLILVDGVERDLTYIDPNEVESVTILKDASSTAVFGVRGANGVILVTTKRGRSDKPEINLTSEYGLQSFTRTPSQVDSYNSALLRNQAGINDGLPANNFYSNDAIQHFKNQDLPNLYPNTDYTKLLLYKNVPQTRYNLNVSGGGNYVNYFINANYLHQGGQWKIEPGLNYDPSSKLDRYNFRSNIDAFLNKSKTLKTFLNVAGYLEKVNQPGLTIPGATASTVNNYTNVLLSTIFTTPNYTPGPLAPDGNVLTGNNRDYPAYGEINRSGYLQETRSNVTASFGLEQDLKGITKGLSTKFMASFDSRAVFDLFAQRSYLIEQQTITGNTVTYSPFNSNVNTPLNVTTANTFASYFNFQYFINYNRTFGKSTVSGLFLAQQEQRTRPLEAGNPAPDTFYIPFNLRGLAARATYGYDNRYFAEFNAGYNGSEQFAKGHRYGFFPSGSAAWVISNESFLKNNQTLTTLKVRGSFGQVGSDRLGSARFLYLDNTKVAGGGYSSILGKGQTINEFQLGNPNIQWEVATKADVGLEVGLFNNLNLTVDLFHEQRNNVLIGTSNIPSLFGYPGTLPPLNAGRVSNKGYELEMNYRKPFNKDLSIFVKGNFNYAKNIVQYSGEVQQAANFAARYYQQGYPFGQNTGMVANGYWNSQQEIINSGLKFIGVQPRPGDLKLVDENGDGIIDNKDVVPIGYSNIPQYTYAGAFTVNYKGFDVSLLMQGVFHVSNYFGVPGGGFGVFENNNNVPDYRNRMLNAWTPERYAAGLPIDFPALSTTASSSESVANSFFLENTSYLRLKNAEIGYTLPEKIAGKIGAQRIRFYTNGLNLITWDKMKTKDFDPEVANSLTYPIIKTFNFGVNVAF